MNDSLDANLVDKHTNAQMVELVDTLDSKSGIREGVGVRLPLWASSMYYFYHYTAMHSMIHIVYEQNDFSPFDYFRDDELKAPPKAKFAKKPIR